MLHYAPHSLTNWDDHPKLPGPCFFHGQRFLQRCLIFVAGKSPKTPMQNNSSPLGWWVFLRFLWKSERKWPISLFSCSTWPMKNPFDNHSPFFGPEWYPKFIPKVRTPATSADVKLKPSGCLFWLKNRLQHRVECTSSLANKGANLIEEWCFRVTHVVIVIYIYIYELGFKIVENCRMFKVSELDNLLNGWIGALRQACPVCASHNAWWSRSS